MVLLGPIRLPSWRSTLKVVSKLWAVLLFTTMSNIERTVQWALGDNPGTRAAYSKYLTARANNYRQRRIAPLLNLLDAQLRKIQSPTLLMLSASDGTIGYTDAVEKRARQMIQHLQEEIIPNARHMINTDSPAFVNARIGNFRKEE